MRTLAQFLRSHRERIVAEWERRTAVLPSAQGLSRRARRDHIPMLLDALAAAIDRDEAMPSALEEFPLVHARERWSQHYDLREVVAEYRLLRRVILDVHAETGEDMPAAARVRLPPLATLNENLDHAITDAVDQYAVERERMREYFVGMLSHDLRDPLNTISLGAEALRHGTDGAAAARVVERIAANAVRMKRLIDDMLDVTRIRLGGGLPVAPVDADLHALACDTVRELAGAHPARDIACEEAAPGGDYRGAWDPVRIDQALANLVANAIKHGGDPVRVLLHDAGADVLLEVRNRGAIPEPLRPRIFEPFTTRDPGAGVGLGLYIASEIALAHGGELTLADDAPDETRFVLRLPRVPAREERAGGVAAAP